MNQTVKNLSYNRKKYDSNAILKFLHGMCHRRTKVTSRIGIAQQVNRNLYKKWIEVIFYFTKITLGDKEDMVSGRIGFSLGIRSNKAD
jgi:ribosomal protein L31E